MPKPTYLTKAIGLGHFGNTAISYLQKQNILNLTLFSDGNTQTENLKTIEPADNIDNILTKVVLFITELNDEVDLELIERYKPDFYVTELFKIVVALPVDPEKTTESFHLKNTLNQLKKAADSVVILTRISGDEAFVKTPEEAVYEVVKSFNSVINIESEVNVDFEDIKTVLAGKVAVVGAAEASGEGRALLAAMQATSAPFMQQIPDSPIILLSIISGPIAELEMDELNEICDYIQDKFGEESELIFGHGIDDGLGNSIRVMIMASVPAEEADLV